MSDGLPHFALREWRRHMAHPATLAVTVGTAVVLGLVGPFDTRETLGLPARLAYWAAVVFGTYSVGFLAGEWIAPARRGWPIWARVLGVGLPAGIGVLGVVVALNLVTFGRFAERAEYPGFAITVVAITVTIVAILELAGKHLGPVGVQAPVSAPAAPPILRRLPLDKRGALVALSVEDHYVRIVTARGSGLVLMRLADAVDEVGATRGARVHRSHWVAFDQVRASRRTGDGAWLTMTTGEEIPVSRANMPAIREAGLLPR